MLASRSMKPKLTLSISTASAKPSLSLPPCGPLRSPISPVPLSPTARNTKLNQRGYSTLQPPTYTYSNRSSSKSILKKGQATNSVARRQLQFCDKPVIYCVSPIEDESYYGSYNKTSRDERRWARR